MSPIVPFVDARDFRAAVDLAKTAAAAYYDTDAQVLSDADYDLLLDRISASITDHPEWDDEGLLSRVAGGASAGGDVTHPTPMLSLAKAKEREDVSAFVASLAGPATVEVKLDGMAIRAEYAQGRLVLLATRGDGITGENVTSQAHLISGLPEELPSPLTLEVRGEVFMTDQNFEIANNNRVSAGKPAFVNPRNATAGSLRNADLSYEAPMSFAAYDASGATLDTIPLHTDRMGVLMGLGIQTAMELVDGKHIQKTSDEVLARIDHIQALRSTLGFPIDGAVIKAADSRDRERLGSASRVPKWAVAFKYPADVATTVLRDIEVAVGRTGRISLRAVLDPVFVGGTTITYATLHNPKFVMDADFRIGDTVFVYRAGDVIPRVNAVDIARRTTTATPWIAPAACPVCNEPWDKSSLLWRCHTPSCSTVGRLEYAASRDVLDIDGFSTAMAEGLVESGLASNIADLFDLTVDQVAALPVGDGSRNVGALVATKIVNGIQASKQQPLNRIITALGIRATGRTMGRRLANHFRSLDALTHASIEQLCEVEGIGTERATLIREGLLSMAPVIERLIKAGVTADMGDAQSETDQGTLPLAGKTVVVSGSVPGLSRTEANEWVERLGGKSSGSVSKNTSLLVAGDGSGSKSEKAAALGVPVMSAEDFAAMVQTAQ